MLSVNLGLTTDDYDDLQADLETIDGVGESTSEKCIEIVESYTAETPPQLAKAIERAQEGNDRSAAIWLRRVANSEGDE